MTALFTKIPLLATAWLILAGDGMGQASATTGDKAADFAHRFSTKYLDAETGLYYYGYRYYDPLTGRWPSRDPIGEEGGLNLYGFVENKPNIYIDVKGNSMYRRKRYSHTVRGTTDYSCGCDDSEGEVTNADEASCPKNLFKYADTTKSYYSKSALELDKRNLESEARDLATDQAANHCSSLIGRCKVAIIESSESYTISTSETYE